MSGAGDGDTHGGCQRPVTSMLIRECMSMIAGHDFRDIHKWRPNRIGKAPVATVP